MITFQYNLTLAVYVCLLTVSSHGYLQHTGRKQKETTNKENNSRSAHDFSQVPFRGLYSTKIKFKKLGRKMWLSRDINCASCAFFTLLSTAHCKQN